MSARNSSRKTVALFALVLAGCTGTADEPGPAAQPGSEPPSANATPRVRADAGRIWDLEALEVGEWVEYEVRTVVDGGNRTHRVRHACVQKSLGVVHVETSTPGGDSSVLRLEISREDRLVRRAWKAPAGQPPVPVDVEPAPVAQAVKCRVTVDTEVAGDGVLVRNSEIRCSRIEQVITVTLHAQTREAALAVLELAEKGIVVAEPTSRLEVTDWVSPQVPFHYAPPGRRDALDPAAEARLSELALFRSGLVRSRVRVAGREQEANLVGFGKDAVQELMVK